MRIIRVARSEFELENGKIFPIDPPLDFDISPEEFQEHYDYCGAKHDLKLSDSWLSCPCGNEIDRDYNAAINIKLAGASRDVTPVETQALAASEWMP